MENWQKVYIKEKKLDLVSETVCTLTLLNKLESAGLLGEDDKSSVVSGGSGVEQSTRLYDILVKSDSYDVLLQALISERQMAAAAILQRGIERQRTINDMRGTQQGAGNEENGDKELLIPQADSDLPLKYRKTVILLTALLIVVVITCCVVVAVAFIFVAEKDKFVTFSPTLATTTSTMPTTTTRPTTAHVSTTTEMIPCATTPFHSGWTSCPDGDRWDCWGSEETRNIICRDKKFVNHTKIIRNKWGIRCFCCGICPIPL